MVVRLFCLCLPWVTKTGKLSLWIKSEVLFPDSSRALWEMSCKWYLWIGLWDWMKIKQNIYVGMEDCAYSHSHSAGWGRRIVRTVTTQQSSWLMCLPLLFPVPLHFSFLCFLWQPPPLAPNKTWPSQTVKSVTDSWVEDSVYNLCKSAGFVFFMVPGEAGFPSCYVVSNG